MKPWELVQFVRFQIPLQPFFVQEGWKEADHKGIIDAKNKISERESIHSWELLKKLTNPYEAIFSGSDDNQYPSLAKVYPLSRSYFKMIEMLYISNFWKNITGPFVSAHICEGPGGFIQSVIESLKRKNIPIKGVHAMTLKPTKTHIPGWRRSIHFLRKHPQINLIYGADKTGNILIPENQTNFCSIAAGSSLFTADGGFDFSVDYGKQEQLAFPLLLASFTIGLGCLAKGGTMIIKLFDIYSEITQDLFLGSATFFESFTLYKPATSRPCNSERYFIARGFKQGQGQGDLTKWIQHLKDAQSMHMQTPLTRLVKNAWPPEILQAIQEQIKWQESQQIKSIEETLAFNIDTIASKITQNIEVSTEWCKVFNVPH